MRNDFHKLFMERPRSPKIKQHRRKLRPCVYSEDDGSPNPVNVTRYLGRYRRDKSYRFAPMDRFLRSQVGRKWSEVYSELKEKLDARNYAQWRFLQRLEHRLEDQVGRDSQGRMISCSWGTPRVYEGYGNGFYVDPEGYLRAEAYFHPIPWEKKLEIVPIKDETGLPKGQESEYALIEGIWYYTRYHWYHWKQEHRGYHMVWLSSEKKKVIDYKKQLNKKELEALGLKNEVSLKLLRRSKLKRLKN